MIDPVLQNPNLRLAADSNQVLNYQRDPHNYITQVFGEQLPAIKTGFFNVHLTKGIIIQPHWHTNVNELVYVIHGEVITSVFDPFTQRLISYHLKPGQVSMFPKAGFTGLLRKAIMPTCLRFSISLRQILCMARIFCVSCRQRWRSVRMAFVQRIMHEPLRLFGNP